MTGRLIRLFSAAAFFFQGHSLAAATTQPATENARRLCDELLKTAIIRPYGMAWGNHTTPPIPAQIPQVSWSPDQSAAAAISLWLAGDALHEPRYSEAAISVARAMALSQQPTGKVPDACLFAISSDRGTDKPSACMSTRSTCGALALWLLIVSESPTPPDLLKSSLLRARAWLTSQQRGGGWSFPYSPTEDASKVEPLYVLNHPDWRDCAFAMLLCADILHDDYARQSVNRQRTALLSLRVTDSEALGVGDFSAAYDLAHQPRKDLPDEPYALDVGATKFAMQTLLADCLYNDEPGLTAALDQANQSLLAVRNIDGTWNVRYYFWQRSATRPAEAPTATTLPSRNANEQHVDGIDQLTASVAQLSNKGPAAYRANWQSRADLRRQLVLAMCGLLTDPCESVAHDINAAIARPSQPVDLAAVVREIFQSLPLRTSNQTQ